MAEDTFSIVHGDGTLEVPGSTLLVGIDETGHELFSDRKYPVFGMGGCAVLLRDYERFINAPWRYMKAQFFDGVDLSLHAAELRHPNPEQLNALENFFTKFPFYRFAVMSGGSLVNDTKYPLIQIVCSAVWERIADIAKWGQPTEVVVVIEESHRTKKDVYRYLAGFHMGNSKIKIQPQLLFGTKEGQQSFLEVADFVMHSAGTQVRNRLVGRSGIRKDFKAVFHRVDRRLTSYIELVQVNLPSQ